MSRHRLMQTNQRFLPTVPSRNPILTPTLPKWKHEKFKSAHSSLNHHSAVSFSPAPVEATDFSFVLRLGGVLGGNFFPPLLANNGGIGGGGCLLPILVGLSVFTTISDSCLSCNTSSNSDFLLGVCTPGFSITAATSTTLIELAL